VFILPGALARQRRPDGIDMTIKTLLRAAAIVLLTTAAASAVAEDAPSSPPMPDHGEAQHYDGAQPAHGPDFAVVNDLEQLRRLYAMTGHEGDIIAVYHEVLNNTQNPLLRHFVYDSLAREQLRPSNPDQAIATLRTSLAEDLAASNRRPRGDRFGVDMPQAPDAPPAPRQ
jgi:hypothetical protein